MKQANTNRKQKAQKPGSRSLWNRFRHFLFSLISGAMLLRPEVLSQWKYILLLMILALVYIFNQHHAEQKAMEIITLKEQVKKLRSKSISISSELLYMTNQVEIGKQLQKRGLHLQQATEPPEVIFIKDEKAEKSQTDGD